MEKNLVEKDMQKSAGKENKRMAAKEYDAGEGFGLSVGSGVFGLSLRAALRAGRLGQWRRGSRSRRTPAVR